MFLEGATTAMLPALKVFPLFLYVFVAFKLYVALGKFVSVFDVSGQKVAEEQSIDAFVLIFWLDGH